MIQKCDFKIGDTTVNVIMQNGFAEKTYGASVQSHCHPNFELHYIDDGEFRFTCSDRTFVLSKHTLVLIPPKQYHSFEVSEGSAKRLSLEFRLTQNKLGTPLYGKYISLLGKQTDTFIHREFLTEAINVGKSRGILQSEEEICKLRAELTLLFLRVCEILRTDDSDNSKKTPATAELDPSDEDITVIKLLSFIEMNLNRRITLREAARHIGLSERQLQRILNSRMGEGFSRLLAKARITKARELISQSKELSLEEISRLCGYQSYVSFWGQFKKLTSFTPMEYKNRES